MARPVIYSRGSATATINATVGRTVFKQSGEYRSLIRTESRDYLIAAADLVLDGQRTEPQRGDRIVDTLNGQSITIEVLAPGDEACFRYSDPFRITLRIHTKLVDGGI